MSIDYTQVFNQERVKKGKAATDWTVVLVTEGTVLPCGCRVNNAGLSHFVVYHDENCKSTLNPKPDKWTIGKPGLNDETATVILDQEKKGNRLN